MAKAHPGLKTPYKGIKEEDMSRLSADLPYLDKELIKSICPVMGLFNQMTQLFFASVADELRKNNITHYTPENEQRLISIIRRRTAIVSHRETTTRHGRHGVEGTRSQTERAFIQRRDDSHQDQEGNQTEES